MRLEAIRFSAMISKFQSKVPDLNQAALIQVQVIETLSNQ